MTRPPERRRWALWLLIGLVLVHLAGFGLYVQRERQSHLLALYLDARDQWRAGHLDDAAAEYAAFLRERAGAAWPVVLLRTFPDEAGAWFVLGRVDAERHRVDAALADFRHSMALDPGVGRREYRDLLLASGRGSALAGFAREELARDPRSAVALKDLGAALLATGAPAAAADAYERALAALPEHLKRTDPGFRGGLSSQEADLENLWSVALRLAGDPGRANAVCDRLTARQPKGARLDRLCRAYARADAGDAAGSRDELAAYQPPAPEHEALVARLLARLPP